MLWLMCLQVCWKGKFKASNFYALTQFASRNTKEMSTVYTLFSFFQVKLRFTVWIIAILMPVPKLNSIRFGFISAWTLKALTVVLSWSDFLPFLLLSLPRREKISFLLGWMDAKKTYEIWCYGTWVKQLCALPQMLRLTLDHLQILPWLYPFNSLYFAGWKYISLLCCK